ncbi:unnamed protein product [Rotaria sordida]|uniref:Uncharacterized protein n=1 Tax=Rotaria sordida TaxID=392033 RepID=A0A819UU10_9BILA|nr:unnamed protein product [Rotaria sordida]
MKGACILDIDLNETGLKVTIQSSCHPQHISIDVMSVRAEEKIIEKVNEYITRQGRLDVFVNVADILRTGSTVDIPV